MALKDFLYSLAFYILCIMLVFELVSGAFKSGHEVIHSIFMAYMYLAITGLVDIHFLESCKKDKPLVFSVEGKSNAVYPSGSVDT